jgi:ribosomal protein S18 acetylase RimI-like enzyme
MNVHVRTGGRDHLAWLVEHDGHVSPKWVSRCIDLNEYLLAWAGSEIVGFLRYSSIWGSIPYMEMIAVAEGCRRRGVGTALFQAWQAAMAAQGAKLLMTSSVASELEPQAWHRRNGFVESGRLTFGKVEPAGETFFVKDI